MADRYFTNTDHSNLPEITRDEAHSELVQSLNKILEEYPPNSTHNRTFTGFYAGPSSVSLLFFSLSNLFPDLLIKSEPLRYWSEVYLDASLSFRHRTPRRINCGVASEKLCNLALAAVLRKDESSV